jgi:hypothetical protein
LKNQRTKQLGLPTLESDLLAAFEGALVGIIIAVISILLYRIVFHARSTRNLSNIQQETQLLALQQAQAERYAKISGLASGINVQGLKNASNLNIIPRSLTDIQQLGK